MSRDDDVIAKTREVLETCASAGKMISFSEIETRIGEKVVTWNKVLDPIYEELRALGKPDLTSIVIYKTGNQQGYPPFFTAARRGRNGSIRTISSRSNPVAPAEAAHGFEPATRPTPALTQETAPTAPAT
jgi:hypothetical protein